MLQMVGKEAMTKKEKKRETPTNYRRKISVRLESTKSSASLKACLGYEFLLLPNLDKVSISLHFSFYSVRQLVEHKIYV